jgi:hypothetical protein
MIGFDYTPRRLEPQERRIMEWETSMSRSESFKRRRESRAKRRVSRQKRREAREMRRQIKSKEPCVGCDPDKAVREGRKIRKKKVLLNKLIDRIANSEKRLKEYEHYKGPCTRCMKRGKKLMKKKLKKMKEDVARLQMELANR